MSNQKEKKHLYIEYIKTHQLEKLISELTNSLVHSLSTNPIVYMIKYLTGLLSEEERTENNINIPPPYPEGVPIVRYPKFKSKNLLSEYLNDEIWNEFKYIKTRYNNNINDLTIISENSPENKIGICLTDDDCINSYDDLLNDIICQVHNIKKNEDKEFYRVNTFPQIQNEDIYYLNEIKDNLEEISFEFSRNVDGYSFNNVNKNNCKLKEDFEKEIEFLIQENILDKSVKKIDNFRKFDNHIVKKELELIKNLGFENDNYTDKDRALYSNQDQSILVLLNFTNHFKLIVSNKKNDDIIKSFNKAINILRNISFSFQFCFCNYGYITSEISLLGAGFKIYSKIKLNNFEKIKEIIENSKFCDFYFKDNYLYSNQNFLLSDINEVNFFIKYLSKILGIIRLDSSKIEVDLSKKEFIEKNNPITLAYDYSFDKIKYYVSSNGRNLNNILSYYLLNEKENFPIMNDRYEYYIFYHFIHKLIMNIQNFELDEFNHISKPENPREIINLTDNELNLITNINIILMRNMKNYPFPCNFLYQNLTKEFKNSLINIINEKNQTEKFASYYEINSEEGKKIISENDIELKYEEIKNKLNIKELEDNRLIIKFEKPNIYGIINDIDHIKLIYNIKHPKENISKGMANLIKEINEISKHLRFEYDEKFGFFTTDPRYVGIGMKIKFKLIINKLNDNDLNQWTKNKGMIWKKLNHNEVEFENFLTLGFSETEMLTNLLFYIHDIIELDSK